MSLKRLGFACVGCRSGLIGAACSAKQGQRANDGRATRALQQYQTGLGRLLSAKLANWQGCLEQGRASKAGPAQTNAEHTDGADSWLPYKKTQTKARARPHRSRD